MPKCLTYFRKLVPGVCLGELTRTPPNPNFKLPNYAPEDYIILYTSFIVFALLKIYPNGACMTTD